MLTRDEIAARRQEGERAFAAAQEAKAEAARKEAEQTRKFQAELDARRMKKAERDKIDPNKVDVILARRRRRKKVRTTEPMPDNLKPFTARAKARLLKMPPSPGLMLERDPDDNDKSARDSYHWASPHDQPEEWEVQLHAALGTRSGSAMRTFVDQLRDLCQTHWHGPEQGWCPSEQELNAALAFVNGIQPRNETEAALAAQMVAVHWMAMRLAARALQNTIVDDRSAAIVAKLARTYTMQLEALRLNRGRQRRGTRQTIKVQKELHQHVHYHHHRGAGESGGQSHARDGATPDERAALPSENKGGEVVPISSRSRTTGV
jgi:hypothetical protein